MGVVKERMKVGQTKGLNGVKEAFITKDYETLDFGKWLGMNIMQQVAFDELNKKYSDKGRRENSIFGWFYGVGEDKDDPGVILDFIKEEKFHVIVGFLEDFLVNNGE